LILMGHNGAGKSTFINYILGFYTDKKQHPFIPNFSNHFQPLQKGTFGYSPEIAMLDTNLTAEDYITMVSNIRRVKTDSVKVLEAVSLEISPKEQIKKYSKGMRQRLSLALSMVGEPQYLVLDEPTSGLDIFGERAVSSILLNSRDKFQYIISSHSTKLALQLREEIWLFKGGEIIEKFLPQSEEEILNRL
jgi:ABC-2 type transport system ATP-binding protein